MATAQDILKEHTELKSLYRTRNRTFNDNFEMLHQIDKQAEDNMESFVGNDPRTLWNMGTFLLQPRPLQHTLSRRDGLPFDVEQTAAVNLIERKLTSVWEKKSQDYMRIGGPTWFWKFIGTLLATGWFAVSYDAGPDMFVDFISPLEMYPEFSTDPGIGLERLSREQMLPWNVVVRMAKANNWNIGSVSASSTKVKVVHVWRNVGEIEHAIIVGSTKVQDWTRIKTDRIPFVIGAVGGKEYAV